MTDNELATVKLYKFDPEVDAEPRYDEYRVPYQGRTVLDVLRYIYENEDSTFAYRWACTKGFCRACVVSVNGQPALACMKSAEKEMKVEPHPKFRLIKDLLVDFED
ncbi:MAG: 2Fe-2S iron-sulfur cluster-binding protein [Chloroflexota bacterium]